jgi:hypothetical protein
VNITDSSNWVDRILVPYNISSKIRGCTSIISGTCLDNYFTNVDGVYKITEIVENGVIITEKAKIAEAFKSNFETCAEKLAEGFP